MGSVAKEITRTNVMALEGQRGRRCQLRNSAAQEGGALVRNYRISNDERGVLVNGPFGHLEKHWVPEAVCACEPLALLLARWDPSASRSSWRPFQRHEPHSVLRRRAGALMSWTSPSQQAGGWPRSAAACHPVCGASHQSVSNERLVNFCRPACLWQ